MRSTMEWYLRKGIGFVLAVVVTFALTMAAAAQSQDQGKGQGSTAVEKAKDKTKDESKDKTKDKIKSANGMKGGVDGWNGDPEEMAALLAQAKSITLSQDSQAVAQLGNELQFLTKFNSVDNLQMNFQYGDTLQGLKSSLLDLQNDGRDREKDMARGRADRESSV